MIARPRTRSLLTITLACGLALLGACEKGKSNPPDGGGPGKDGTTETAALPEGGKDYVYAADGFKLNATTTVKLELASSQGQGTAELSAKSLIEAKPAGANLEVHGKVLELISYKGTGNLDPEFVRKQSQEQGGEAMDLVAEIAKSEAWMVIDPKGKTDKKATQALPQNQKEEDGGGMMDFGLFGLPDLPRVDLEVGKKVQLPTTAEERQLPFGSIPVEVDVTWTLRAVNNNVAEFDISSEGSGADEFETQGGTGTVSLLEESSFTIFFDLGTKLPVSIEGYSASEIQVDAAGQAISLQTNSEINTKYEVAQ